MEVAPFELASVELSMESNKDYCKLLVVKKGDHNLATLDILLLLFLKQQKCLFYYFISGM